MKKIVKIKESELVNLIDRIITESTKGLKPKPVVNEETKLRNVIKQIIKEEEENKNIENVAQKVADKIEDVLSPEEVNFLTQYYKENGKESIAKVLNKTLNEYDEEPPAEGEFGMSRKEIKLRQILDKIIRGATISSLVAGLPASMMGHPGLAIGLGIAALAGTIFNDAAWWKKGGGRHYNAKNKYR